ncbi:MAG: glycosyltransferase family 2 protein [Alphaproteobacteria bacterium]
MGDEARARTPELTVLVPVYNEAGNLASLAEEIRAALDGVAAYELLFVDDGSGDGSAEELAALRRAMPEIRVIRHASRSGKSAALWTGLKAARAPWIQTLDGDGQNDPADAARAWRWLHSNEAPERLGIVAGQRTSRNDGGFKWLQSRIANGIRRTLLNDGTRDTGCGFKLIRAEAFRDVPFFDGMHRFLPALVRRAGWEVAVLPVTDRPRGQGTSKYGLLGRLTAGIVDLMGVVWLMRRGRFPPGRSGDL